MSKKGHRGNTLIPSQHEEVALTDDQLREFIRCKNDIVYFVKTYMKIIHPDRGLINFDLWDWQEEMLHLYEKNRFVISRVARQSGKTSVTVAFILHYVLFNKYKQVAILANKSDTAISILGRLRLAYEHLPRWLQQGIITWNKGDIELANGSKVIAAATSDAGIRGETMSIVFLDEFAFVEPNIAEAFYTSTYPVITSGTTTKVLIVSTPNGIGNLYHRMWEAAEKQTNGYIPYTVEWWQVPGRDKKFREDTIKRTSLRQWKQEFEIEFLGSSDTLIDGEVLKKLAKSWVAPLTTDEDGLKIFKEPEENRKYAMSVDVARGVLQNYSAFVVFDVTEIPYQIVATYRNNDITPMLFPRKIYEIGMKYNEAFVLIELDGNGSQVADGLHYDFEYSNMYSTTTKPTTKSQTISGGFSGKPVFGLKQNKSSKKIGCTNLKALVEETKLIIPDETIVSELSTFVVSRGDSYAAQQGSNDDLVMCLVMFAWMAAQKLFRETSNTDIFKELQGVKEEAEQMFPIFETPRQHVYDIAPVKGKLVEFEGNDLWFSEDESDIDNPLLHGWKKGW
jgi:hypothetical protein